VEERLVAYLDLRAENCKRDKCTVPWLTIKELKFADQLGHEGFKASDGWLYVPTVEFIHMQTHFEALSALATSRKSEHFVYPRV